MNTTTQAQKGFKTFILTLVVSLLVFSAVYYFINSDTSSVGQSDSYSDVSFNEQPVENEEATLGDTSERMGVSEESVFEELANEKLNISPPEVLAGADDATTETPEATVPVTGISGPTSGIILATIILGFAAYLIYIGPRSFALASFEKKVLEELD